MNVLIVEDDPLVCEMVCEAVLALQHQAVVAATGKDAMRILDRSLNGGGPIDVLLADILMPGMNGIELAARASVIRPDLKIILMSGYPADMFSLPDHCHFLAKPYVLDALTELLRPQEGYSLTN